MSDIRYYEEQPCEHGEMRRHRDSIPGKGGVGPLCPGGSRREITLDDAAGLRAYNGVLKTSIRRADYASEEDYQAELGLRGIRAALARGDTREDQV